MGPLSAAEVQQFRDEGYLVLRGFIEQQLVATWLDDFWSHVGRVYPGFQLADRGSWQRPDGSGHKPVDDIWGCREGPNGEDRRWGCNFSALPQMRAVVTQLGAAGLVEPDAGSNGVLVVWPASGHDGWRGRGDWKLADANQNSGGHVDGYHPAGEFSGGVLNALAYLHEVRPGGGAHVLWPRSHLAIRRFLEERPEQLDGTLLGDESLAMLRVCGAHPPMRLAVPLQSGWRTVFEDAEVGAPVEITGHAGDVILRHHMLAHTGTINVVEGQPRVAVFATWRHKGLPARYHTSERGFWEAWSEELHGAAARL